VVVSEEESMSKLRRLIEIEGHGSLGELALAMLSDGASLGICTNKGCDYTTRVSMDQNCVRCDVCGTTTVRNALTLAS
jgi:hypothetical protein